MGSYSSSKKYTTTTSESKTLGAQDQAIIAEGNATVNVLDEGAVENSFKLADNAFNSITANTSNAMELAGIYSNNENKNLELMMDSVNRGLNEALSLSSYAIERQGDIVDNAVAAAYNREEFSEGAKPNIVSGENNIGTYLGYGAGILGIMFVLQGLK